VGIPPPAGPDESNGSPRCRCPTGAGARRGLRTTSSRP